ncbi:MAG: low molecular weight protein-tyrosine-phosphatase [Chitinophagales bacterium]
MKVLMVCLGNICRSPLAEGLLKRKAEEKGLDWEIESAGTGAWHIGEKPDSRSIEVAEKHGLDITNQRARKFSPKDFDHFDLIYAMDTSNYRDLIRQAHNREEEDKVEMILNEAYPGMNRAVPDPYYKRAGFEEVYGLLDKACGKIVEKYA